MRSYDYRAMAVAASVRGPIHSGWNPTAVDLGWPQEVDDPKPEAQDDAGLSAFLDALCKEHYHPDWKDKGVGDNVFASLYSASRRNPEWPGKRDGLDELAVSQAAKYLVDRWEEEDRERSAPHLPASPFIAPATPPAGVIISWNDALAPRFHDLTLHDDPACDAALKVIADSFYPGQKIAAIKALRDASEHFPHAAHLSPEDRPYAKMGLKDAKDAVDEAWQRIADAEG